MGVVLMERGRLQSQLRVSFVIPAMNEATMIVGVLDSIRRQRLRSDVSVAEVIVVDPSRVTVLLSCSSPPIATPP